MSTEKPYTLGGLAERNEARRAMHKKDGCYDGATCCRYLLYFLLLWFIVGAIIALANPCWIRCHRDGKGRDDSRDCEDDCDGFLRNVNWGRLVGYSFVIALVIAVIFWIVCCCGGFSGCGVGSCGY